ncbi:MAG: hypothetical protein N5P05_003065 [Chroococcopsis gigantea SAG 12.99]|nr:hypothetical protein [Chroococcopsis gigantea SAG 12.99]
MMSGDSLLTEPFLQCPAADSVCVVWFTEFRGTKHEVVYGENLLNRVIATTKKLTKMREDEQSRVYPSYRQVTPRDIWRHKAKIENLKTDEHQPYRVISSDGERQIESDTYILSPSPSPDRALKILLTSDHQLMPMTAANLQKVVETVGQVDAVFHAGDLVNVPDRASEWFDDYRGGSFFPCLQGRAHYHLEKEGVTTVYKGGQIIQSSPLFTTIGNHEVMGRFDSYKPLNEQFNDAIPRHVARELAGDESIKDHSFNTDSYEEIFTLPRSPYYAVTFGNIRLVVLYVTQIWRLFFTTPDVKGRFQERFEDLSHPGNWGYGQHIFEPISRGSEQYGWLQQELASAEFKEAKYKIVMLHHPPHSLGGNVVPPFTDPVQNMSYDAQGKINGVTYNYPPENDYIVRDLLPLLEESGVGLVYYGHCHLWNRFIGSNGTHYLESSNVGNTYGAFSGDKKRPVPEGSPYASVGDPNGLNAIVPNIAPLLNHDGQPLSYIASNDITVFSIFDTEKGIVSSYRYDTRYPDSAVIKFDEFYLQ